MTFLIDTSAIWHLLRNPGTREVWEQEISAKSVGISDATRVEFLFSAQSPRHRDELAEDLDLAYAYVPVPKKAWAWIETAQYKLTQMGQHRSAGVVDLLLCATAVLNDLTLLHVDNDFKAVASVLTELRQRDIRR
ncbi:PIN domain-containing protein [Glycomyces arizonensis]|uniref:PIN domain-containing protein n=1 Tax=Glycomyces arizonensis TaxID=256035 RepID=UPI0004183800|nr:PIN domain-containing protein [Glycomyces arizonensis]